MLSLDYGDSLPACWSVFLFFILSNLVLYCAVFLCLQYWLKAMCVLRHNPGTQASVASSVGLLGCYMAGVRYALELQALQRGTAEPSQPDDDDTNQSVSSIEDDFVTALEHLEEDDTGDNPCRLLSNV